MYAMIIESTIKIYQFLIMHVLSGMASSQGNQSQKSSSSSSGSSNVPSLEPHQPSMEYPITGSTSASGSSGDQPGPSGLQAGLSGLQVHTVYHEPQ